MPCCDGGPSSTGRYWGSSTVWSSSSVSDVCFKIRPCKMTARFVFVSPDTFVVLCDSELTRSVYLCIQVYGNWSYGTVVFTVLVFTVTLKVNPSCEE